jgi:hypothetical protein
MVNPTLVNHGQTWLKNDTMGWKQETGLAKERDYKAYRC